MKNITIAFALLSAAIISGCSRSSSKKEEPVEFPGWKTYSSGGVEMVRNDGSYGHSGGVVRAVEVTKRKEYEDSRRVSVFINHCNDRLRREGSCSMKNVILGKEADFIKSYFELMGFEVKIEPIEGSLTHNLEIGKKP